MYVYHASFEADKKWFFTYRSQNPFSGMMFHLVGESFKAEGNVLFSNFLVSASADTKVKMYKALLAWGRGRGQSIK